MRVHSGTQTPNEEVKHIPACSDVNETINENTLKSISYNGKLIIIADQKRSLLCEKKTSIHAVRYGSCIWWEQSHRRKNSLMQMLVGHPGDAHLSDQCFKDTKHTDSGPTRLQLAHYSKSLKGKSWLTHIQFLYFKILSELWYLTLTNVYLLKVSLNPKRHSYTFFYSEGQILNITSSSPTLDSIIISKLSKISKPHFIFLILFLWYSPPLQINLDPIQEKI